MNRRGITNRLGALIAAIIACLCVTAGATAQGTMNMLPDPISSGELAGYLKQLGLLEPQKQAAASLHEQYKADFKRFREAEVEKFMEETRKLNQFGRMPKLSDMESVLHSRERLTNRIAAMDETLFAGLTPLMGPEQLEKLPRVRMTRDRVRNTPQMMMPGMGAANVDLSAILNKIKLTDEERLAIDGVVQSYETRLTHLFKELNDATTGMWVDAMKALDKMGYNDQTDFTNPETVKGVTEAMQSVWADLTKKLNAAADDITNLNRQTFKAVAASLPRPQARKLRERYYRKAYPEAFFGSNGTEPRYDRALKFKELTPQQRETIQAAQLQYETAADSAEDSLIQIIDEFRRNLSPFDMTGSVMQDHQKKLQDATQKRMELATNASTALEEILGPELSPRLHETQIPEAAKVAMPGLEQGADGALSSEDADAVAFTHGPDMFLPPAITAAEISSYVRFLGLSDDEKAILAVMHRDYMTRYEAVTNKEIRETQEAQGEVWNHAGSTLTSEQRVDKLYQSRVAALAAIRAADESFFAEVADMLLATDQQRAAMTRVRTARERVVANRAGAASGMFGGFSSSRESSMDLVSILEHVKAGEADYKAADAVLADYEKSVTPAMKRRLDVAMASQKSFEIINARMSERSEASETAVDGLEWQRIWKEEGAKVAAVNKEIAQINRQTLPKLLAALPDDTAARFRKAYNKAAFPNVYQDRRSPQPKLEAALRLPDLTDDQRRQISDVIMTFSGTYETISEKMIGLSPDTGWVDFEGQGMDDWQKRESQMGTLRFERDEACDQAIIRLRGLLSPDQVATLGGLEIAGKRREFEAYMMDEAEEEDED